MSKVEIHYREDDDNYVPLDDDIYVTLEGGAYLSVRELCRMNNAALEVLSRLYQAAQPFVGAAAYVNRYDHITFPQSEELFKACIAYEIHFKEQ